MKVWLTIEEGDRVCEILKKFLEESPEIVIKPGTVQVATFYKDTHTEYILDSFANFLEQLVPENQEDAKEL